MATTIEHSTVLDARNQLTIGFKWDMQTLASRFNSEGLISDGCHETVTNPKTRYDESEKSTLMVADIVNRINLNKENYHKMMKILSSNQLQNGDLIRILDNIYTSKGGKCSYSIETVPPVYDGQTHIEARHLSGLIEMLSPLAHSWEKIGGCLGFQPNEIANIKANPMNFPSAPGSYLSEMLSKWSQWAPNDARSSRNVATLEGLKSAVNRAGFAQTANELSNKM